MSIDKIKITTEKLIEYFKNGPYVNEPVINLDGDIYKFLSEDVLENYVSTHDKYLSVFQGFVHIEDGERTVKLNHVPVSPIEEIFLFLGSDPGEIGERYAVENADSKPTFSIKGNVITLPEGVTSGEIYVMYTYKICEEV